MRAMIRYRAIEWLSVVGLLAALAFSFWFPGALWPTVLAGCSVVAAVLWRDPQRRSAVQYRWTGPVILLLMAAQFVVFPGSGDRTRMTLYAAAYVIAGVILWLWYRPWK